MREHCTTQRQRSRRPPPSLSCTNSPPYSSPCPPSLRASHPSSLLDHTVTPPQPLLLPLAHHARPHRHPVTLRQSVSPLALSHLCIVPPCLLSCRTVPIALAVLDSGLDTLKLPILRPVSPAEGEPGGSRPSTGRREPAAFFVEKYFEFSARVEGAYLLQMLESLRSA